MKQNKQALWVAGVLVLSMGLSGCVTSNLTGTTYRAGEARTAQEVQFGVVESVTPVVIEGHTEAGVGAGAGALVGGVAGSNIGRGRGAIVGSVLGAVAGGVAGQAIEKQATQKQGQEITVRLTSGRLMSVVQEVANGQFFKPGDQVKLLQMGRTARVVYR